MFSSFFFAFCSGCLISCLLASCLFQHVDIASLLIKHNTDVNATDRWLFTPLHEAAQKGRTQLCALLVSILDNSNSVSLIVYLWLLEYLL